MTKSNDYTPIPPVAPPSMEDCCSNFQNIPAVQKELMSHRAAAPAAYHDDDDEEQQQQPGLEDGTHRKLCRICLDTDHPDTMIAPCLCKGGSQWVHRDCLDEWRVHEEDRAFSQCTECNFHYHFVDTRHERRQLKTRFWLFVSRDVCLVTVAVQVVILCLAWMVRELDVWQLQLTLLHFLCLDCENDAATLQDTITNNTTATTTSMGALRREEFAIYYAYGFISLLVLLGMIGSIVLCQNRCQIPDYLKTETARHTTRNEETRGITTANEQQPHHQQQHPSTTTTTTTAAGREQFYQSRRHQRSLSRGGTDLRRGSCCECCCAPTTSSRYYSGYPYYYGPNYVYYGPYYTGNADSSCCCCCCDGSNTPNTNSDCDCCCPFHVGGGGGSSSSGHSGGGNGGGDAMHILLVIVLIVVIVMAVIGFIVGVFLSIFIAQRIIQRHILLLEKRRLVDDFPVKDLSGYDFTTMMMTPPVDPNHPEGTELGSITCASKPTPIPPSRTSLRPEDSSHLKKLGLLKD